MLECLQHFDWHGSGAHFLGVALEVGSAQPTLHVGSPQEGATICTHGEMALRVDGQEAILRLSSCIPALFITS